MSAKKFYLSERGNQIGPFSVEDVLRRLDDKKAQWTDYIFADDLKDWVLLMSHPDFTKAFNAGRARPATKIISMPPTFDLRPHSELREKEWFLLRDGNNYGPFSRLDLVQMLQEKSLFEYDFVWHHGMDAWKRVAEVKDFKPDQIRALKDSKDPDVSEVFFRRRHARAKYGCSLLVHNNKTVFKGESFEISEGGAGVVIENPGLQPGQTIYLHFQPGDGVPPFNAICNIVSKSWVKESSEPQAVRYGVKFSSMSQSVRESIRDFTKRTAA